MAAIDLTDKPLPSPDAKALHEWLNKPEAFIYQRYLASLAANHAAIAANKMVEGKEPDHLEVKEEITKAVNYQFAHKVIDEMRVKDYKFHPVELQPEIVTH